MKTHTKIVLASVVAGAIGIVGFVSLADAHGKKWGRDGGFGGRGPAMILGQMDANSDGDLTLAEIDEFRTSTLAKFDANGDQALTLDEFQNAWLEMMRPRMVDSFQRLDEDGDAIVTDQEIQTPLAMLTRRLDRNEDGVISSDEMRRKRGHRRHDEDDNN